MNQNKELPDNPGDSSPEAEKEPTVEVKAFIKERMGTISPELMTFGLREESEMWVFLRDMLRPDLEIPSAMKEEVWTQFLRVFRVKWGEEEFNERNIARLKELDEQTEYVINNHLTLAAWVNSLAV